MAIAVKRAGHDQKLGVVEHLDELRTRMIVSLAVARGSVRGVHLAEPRAAAHRQRAVGDADAEAGPRRARAARRGVHRPARTRASSRPARHGRRRARAARQRRERGHARLAAAIAPRLQRTIARLSAPPQGDKPVTLGIGEPFTTTIGISLIFALILSLPILLTSSTRSSSRR